MSDLTSFGLPVSVRSQLDLSGALRGMEEHLAKSRAEAAGFAATMFAALKLQIEAFQARLGANAEVGAILSNFGAEPLHVSTLAYRHPHLIVLRGRLLGQDRDVELLQHVSQVNLLLVPVVPSPGQPPRRVGFRANADEGDVSSSSAKP